MKKKSYFSFLCGKLIAGLLIGVIVFAATAAYMQGIYNISVRDGFDEVGEKYKKLVEYYDEGVYDSTFIDIITNLYAADYVRFAKVGEDGSFETIFESDYDVIPVELNTVRRWVYITQNEELLAQEKRTTNISGEDWTIEYKKCDEIWNIDRITDTALSNSWNTTSFSSGYQYGNYLFRGSAELCGIYQYSLPSIRSYYIEGDTLHIGKIAEVDGYIEDRKGGKSWDFTDPANADKYIEIEIDGSETDLYIYQLAERPDKFLNDNADIFLAGSTGDLESSCPREDSRTVVYSDSNHEYFVQNMSGSSLVQGKMLVTKINGQWYMIEYVMETLPYSAYLKPFFVVLAIFLLVLSIGIPCLSAIKPYSQYKMAYENNRFKNNLIDSLAHNLKTPLQILGGYAENLKDTTNEADKNRYADEILATASGMNKDIEALLKTADKTSLTLSKTSISKCLEEVASKAGAGIDIKGDAEYKIEKDYFNTALFCLVDNAAKYGNKDSKIEATVNSKAITIRNKTAAGNYTPGTGIAIAGRIMEQHNLKLTTDLKDGVFEAKISTK